MSEGESFFSSWERVIKRQGEKMVERHEGQSILRQLAGQPCAFCNNTWGGHGLIKRKTCPGEAIERRIANLEYVDEMLTLIVDELRRNDPDKSCDICANRQENRNTMEPCRTCLMESNYLKMPESYLPKFERMDK